MTIHDQRATLSVEETGDYLGIGRNLAYQKVRTGEIPSLRLGKRILVPKSALAALLSGVAGEVG